MITLLIHEICFLLFASPLDHQGINARCNTGALPSHHLPDAYLFFHPTHLWLCVLWVFLRTARSPAITLDLLQALTPEVLFFHQLELGAVAGGFPKRGPRTTHGSLSGFQVNISSSSLILPHSSCLTGRLFSDYSFFPPLLK